MKKILCLVVSLSLLVAVPVLACEAHAESTEADSAEAEADHADHADHAMHGEHDEHAAHRQMLEQAAAEPEMQIDVDLRDLELLDSQGRPLRLSSDVIGDKLVAMTFVYSSCTTICPIYSALFGQIQELLGDRLDREVVLVTLTLDPNTDVPLRLQREAQKYGARPGWYYLTGEPSNVEEVLRGLDAYFADFTQHPPMALIGDGKTGSWKRYNGFPEPAQVVAMLDELQAARDAS